MTQIVCLFCRETGARRGPDLTWGGFYGELQRTPSYLYCKCKRGELLRIKHNSSSPFVSERSRVVPLRPGQRSEVCRAATTGFSGVERGETSPLGLIASKSQRVESVRLRDSGRASGGNHGEVGGRLVEGGKFRRVERPATPAIASIRPLRSHGKGRQGLIAPTSLGEVDCQIPSSALNVSLFAALRGNQTLAWIGWKTSRPELLCNIAGESCLEQIEPAFSTTDLCGDGCSHTHLTPYRALSARVGLTNGSEPRAALKGEV
jgi:hypothetical protein